MGTEYPPCSHLVSFFRGANVEHVCGPAIVESCLKSRQGRTGQGWLVGPC